MSVTLQTDPAPLQIEPLTPTIGAVVRGVRMSGDLPDACIDAIRGALLDWKVIFFRDQDVSVAEHVAFGRRFGELEIHPFTPNRKDHPEVVIIQHEAGSKSGQNTWHSDVTWRLEPSLGSILRAKIVPPVGGDTLFADMARAYELLDDATRERIEGLHAIHSFTRYFGGNLSDEKRAEMQREYPDARHPVVRTHPETGAKSIYVNAAFTSHIEGMEEDESRRLLRRLYRQASIPEVQCRFRWEKDSVAFWDNRAVQHYAAFDYLPATRRVERVTIEGDRPFCGPAAGERR
ncbi:MAG: TauD/TfdA family dioxygenase [Myxococcota bacterium]|nr:TauD/TfdA family dioxygenase [Myxococcota bacterium]